MSLRELAEHLARRLHWFKGHLADYERCTNWECVQVREALAQLDARERVA